MHCEVVGGEATIVCAGLLLRLLVFPLRENRTKRIRYYRAGFPRLSRMFQAGAYLSCRENSSFRLT